MITVAEINDVERLSSLRLLWRSLLSRTRNASFFHSFEWFEHYMRHFGQEQKLRTLVVSVAGNPIGIAPFVVKPVETRLGTVRALTYPLDGWGTFYGPIGQHTAATLMAAMRHIATTRRDWDIVDLRYVDFEGIDRGRTRNSMRVRGLSAYRRKWRESSAVDITQTWDDYWHARRPDDRSKYSVLENALHRRGQVRFERHRPNGLLCGDTERRRDLFLAFERIAESAMPRVSDDLHQSINPTDLDFLRDLHADAVDSGAVDLNVLYVANRPAAASYNYASNGIVEAVRTITAADAPPGVGTVLTGHMLQDSFERGDRAFVFNRHDTDLASTWKTSTRTSYRYTHFAALGPRAAILHLNHCLRHREDTTALPPVLTAVASDEELDVQPPAQLTIVG